jgi:predicted RNase H-like HicB family nuclease
MEITALVTRSETERLFVAQGVELDVASQGRTPAEALRNLQEAIELCADGEPGTLCRLPYAEVRRIQVNIPALSVEGPSGAGSLRSTPEAAR